MQKDDNDDSQLEPPAVSDSYSISGSNPSTESDDDLSEAVEEVIGNEPQPGKPFSLADEVEKDEKALSDIPPDEAKIGDSEE